MNLRSRVSIFDTLTTKTTISVSQLNELVNFLVLNRASKLSPTEVRATLSSRALTVTPITAIFSRMLDLHKDDVFAFVRLPPTMTSIPEVVTYSHITFDLKQFNTPGWQQVYAATQAIPGFTDKIFTNLTTLLRRTGEPIDALNLQALVVRDLLSRSYFDNQTKGWLEPSLLRFLCRFYNMSMSSAVSSAFNLTIPQQQVIATMWSLYFLQLCSDTESAEALISTMNLLELGPKEQVRDVIKRLKEILSPEEYAALTFDTVCGAISKMGIAPRLESINRKFYATRMANVGPDKLTSMMALEYPPYWCYIVLLALSGRKMGLTNTLKRNNLAREAPDFSDKIVQTQSFLPSL